MTHSSSDVVIVGGGPAGLYSGLRLARAGWCVELFEEHRDIGEPVHCTGVLARDVFDVFGLPTDVVLNELTTVRCKPSALRASSIGPLVTTTNRAS